MQKRDGEIVRFFNPPDMKYVQAVSGVGVTNDFSRHIHRTFCIGVVQRGSRVISHSGRATVIPKNGLFVINPDTAHTCKSLDKKGQSYLALCIDTEHMKTIASTISEKAQPVPYFKNAFAADPELAHKIRSFFSLVENTSSALEREAVLVSLLCTLILHYGDEPPVPCRVGLHDRAIKRACEFIRTHYAQDLSLKQLSRVACLSPFYFQRLFLKNTGISPHDYLVQFRIKKARERLTEGHSIAGVAVDTGFVDQSHFTRSFKRVTGITPGGYISTVLPNTGQQERLISRRQNPAIERLFREQKSD